MFPRHPALPRIKNILSDVGAVSAARRGVSAELVGDKALLHKAGRLSMQGEHDRRPGQFENFLNALRNLVTGCESLAVGACALMNAFPVTAVGNAGHDVGFIIEVVTHKRYIRRAAHVPAQILSRF